MKASQLNRRSRARLGLVGAVAGACALIAFPAPGLADLQTFKCTAGEAAVFPGEASQAQRIHVRCDPGDTRFVPPGQAISYFALSEAHPDASRVLSLIATAVAARRPLSITYEPNDLSGQNAIRCLNQDCRLIWAIGMERE